MARQVTEWPSKRGPITKIIPTDGCKGDISPLAVGKWYDFHEFGCHLGNLGLTCSRRASTTNPLEIRRLSRAMLVLMAGVFTVPMSLWCDRLKLWVITTAFVFAILGSATAAEITVSSEADLTRALLNAKAGDVIEIAPGTYDLTRKHSLKGEGTTANPIVVRAPELGAVVLHSTAVELFKLNGGYWIFENLVIQGTCQQHSRCEHAFHIVGTADGTIIRNNHLRDFNAAIKGNGVNIGSKRRFPSNVLIEGNAFFNSTPRKTSNPVTPIDVVGGSHWVVRGNFIADFAKAGGNRVSYGAFLKGNSRHGTLERNLVICEWKHKGNTRIGLSLGGGGTGKKFCVDNDCTTEHSNGTIRNNIILNCPRDVGIYLNRAKATKIYNNTFYNTGGIDVRFATSDADIWNNLISGGIRNRNGGVHVAVSNTQTSVRMFKNPGAVDFSLVDGAQIVDKGTRPEQVRVDFCGTARPKATPDLGAIEYGVTACDVAAIPRQVDILHPDLSVVTALLAIQTALATINVPEQKPAPAAKVVQEECEVIRRDRLMLHLDRQEVSWDGTPVTLTPLEFKLVLLMSNRPNEVVSDQEIYAVMVADGNDTARQDDVKNVILALRRKFRGVDATFVGIVFYPGRGFGWSR